MNVEYVGSPLYGIVEEHELALLFAIAGLVASLVLWAMVRRGSDRGLRITAPFRDLRPRDRVIAASLAFSALVHAGLALGHEPGAWTLAYGGATGLATWALRGVMRHGAQRRTGLVLVALLGGWVVTGMTGTTPDQLTMVTKLVELTGLLALLTFEPRRGGKAMLRTTAGIAAFVVVAFGSWMGAMAAGDGGHHHGETPPPGVLLPALEERPATAEETAAANELVTATQLALQRYADPAVAEADGYDVGTVRGLDHHADNPTYTSDGVILDPTRPETLVYAAGPDGPVLLGAMFQMEGVGVAGPAVGGPLTVWHGHDHICLTLLPPGLGGVTSPYGTCPVGSVTIPVTNEMLHVFTIDGAPDRFGELDDGWIRSAIGW